jgi:hypothetical protein
MSYLDDFEHSFMQHTLEIIREYKGDFDATILINCLLGLLVIPKEKFLEAIPFDSRSSFSKWKINPDSIKKIGKKTNKNKHPDTLRGFVYSLRNTIAHFRIKPVPATEEVHSFEFIDLDGFHAVIKLEEIRDFVERLSDHLDKC